MASGGYLLTNPPGSHCSSLASQGLLWTKSQVQGHEFALGGGEGLSQGQFKVTLRWAYLEDTWEWQETCPEAGVFSGRGVLRQR